MCHPIAARKLLNFNSSLRLSVRHLALVAGLALASVGALAQDVDPPGRVARLNLLQGNVSQLPAGDSDWSQAEINRPLTSGDRLRTEPGARLELHSGSSAVRLDGAAALDISQLDDNTTRLTLSEGALNLRVRSLYPGEQMEIDTPNLALTVQQPGSYRLEVDPRTGTTRVAARYGAATLYGEKAESLPLVANGQMLEFGGRGLAQAGPPLALQNDGFDLWADGRDRAEDQSISARYVSRDVPGYQQLDSFGDWQNDTTYGAVWLPRITVAEWAPYRYGQWRWIAPWGWTWVDDAPWGFAPFHYGRWAQIGPRWAWVPGPRAPRPTYAPALVGFLGGQPGRADWNVHAGPDRRPGPGIGWFPLAPGEAWRPGFRASPSYLGGINRDGGRSDRRDGKDGRGSRDGDHPYFFQGRPNAVTAVPQADFGRGPAWRPNRPNLRDGDLAGAQLLQAPPMPAMRPGTRPDYGGRRPDQAGAGNDHAEWNRAARDQAEQNRRAQQQADEARQRQQEALQRPGVERQAQQDRLSQEAQRQQVEQLQRQQQQQQQQLQRQQAEGRNQIDPPGLRPQVQQAQQADQRFQQERLQREREQADRAQRDQQQRQQFQQQREQQNQAEQQRARQQAQQAQQGEQLRREQQAQQERMQRDVAQREQIQRQQQLQQQQMQQQQGNQIDPQGVRGRVQQGQPGPQQAQPGSPAEQARQNYRQQFLNRDQR